MFLTVKSESSIHNIGFSSKKLSSESGEKYAQIKQFTSENGLKQF